MSKYMEYVNSPDFWDSCKVIKTIFIFSSLKCFEFVKYVGQIYGFFVKETTCFSKTLSIKSVENIIIVQPVCFGLW